MRASDAGVVVVVVGDKQVGKSTLILSLVAGTFTRKVPGVVLPLVLPPEATRDKAPLSIVDTSSCPSRLPETEGFLRLADAIVLKVAPDVPGSVTRVVSYWLPWFRQLGLNSPVVLAVDLPSAKERDTKGSRHPFQNLVASKEIEACIECSAVTMDGVQEVFFMAHRAGLSPSRPLWDQQQPSVLFAKALRRIFAAFSANKQELTENELGAFHEACFGCKLNPEVAVRVQKLAHESPSATKDSQGLSLPAFTDLHLQLAKIQAHSVWTVLRTFHYGRDLLLDPRFFQPPKTGPRGVELTPEAIEFLTTTFHSHASLSLPTSSSSSPSSSSSSRAPSTVLTPEDFAQVFENCPKSELFGEDLFDLICNHVTGSGSRWLSLSGWLTYFALFGLYCPTQLPLLLGYMGFPGYQRDERRVLALRPREAISCSLLGRTSPQQIIVVNVYGHNPTFSLKAVRDYVGFEAPATSSSVSLFPTTASRPAFSEVYAHQMPGVAPSFLVLSFNTALVSDVACVVHDGSARSTSFIRKLLVSLPPGPVVVLSECRKASLNVWPGTKFKVFVHPFNDAVATVLHDVGVRQRHKLVSTSAITTKRIFYGVAACTGASMLGAALYKVAKLRNL